MPTVCYFLNVRPLYTIPLKRRLLAFGVTGVYHLVTMTPKPPRHVMGAFFRYGGNFTRFGFCGRRLTGLTGALHAGPPSEGLAAFCSDRLKF